MVECKDVKCPVHGSLRTRGTVFEGKVVSTKAKKTAVVDVPYVWPVRKYERLEKRTSKIHAYVPDCMPVKPGDKVRIAECRKLSKTKSFVVTEVKK
jgi:small subunit ribosomal protein S17